MSHSAHRRAPRRHRVSPSIITYLFDFFCIESNINITGILILQTTRLSALFERYTKFPKVEKYNLGANRTHRVRFQWTEHDSCRRVQLKF